MKIICCIIMTTVFFLFGCSDYESEQEQARRLSDTHNIEIKAGDPSLFFPKKYATQDENFSRLTMEGTTLQESKESLDGIEGALATYPPGFVSSIIDTICISGPMKIEGAEAGGTYGTKWIILTNIEKWNGTKANYENALRGVHHELSSLILMRSIFTSITWPDLLPSDWKPAANNYEALMVNYELAQDYNQGFLTEYGKTSMENDFNIYAEFAFVEPERLRVLAQEYPIIAKKLGLFISAYTNISPEFSDYFNKYFAKTGLSDVAISTDKAALSFSINVNDIKPTLHQ